MDSVSKGFEIIKFVVISIAIMLLILFVLKIERNEYIKQVTKEFDERVRYEGYINKDMYEAYMEKVSVAPLRIKFYHTRNRLHNTNTVVEYSCDERIIIKKIYEDGIYKMKKGDDFHITVSEMKISLYDAIMQGITKVPANVHMIVYKGGMVYNESY